MDLTNIKKIEPLKNSRTTYNYNAIDVIAFNAKGVVYNGPIAKIVDYHNAKNKKKMVYSSVFKCAAGHTSKYEKLVWEFSDQEDKGRYNIFESEVARNEILSKNEKYRKPIVAFSKSGDPIEGFENIMDAVLWVKNITSKVVDYKSVIYVADNHGKENTASTAGNYQWRYYEDVIK